MTDLPKTYQPADYEPTIYRRWEESGAFAPQGDGPVFTMLMPPPNVTGTLHLGHAFEHTLQDILVRYHRMRGDTTLWLPGTDHAAIATQAKYEKDLHKTEGRSRHDFTREEFVKRVQDFAVANQQTILNQLKQLGDSVDWSRLAFTLDTVRERAVRTAFKRMYDAGLIYRGYRIVNWDPKGQTTISDDEVVHEATQTTLYTFRYAKNFPISIATTRPETKVGDVAVAVHPNDPRYQQYLGQTFAVNFVGIPLRIKIIPEPSVDSKYGTGALGVTPAHALLDWEMAERHRLPFRQVINEFARMENVGPEFDGQKTTEARELIIGKLRAAGLLEKEESITHNLSKAERTGGVIEPLPKRQWFIDVDRSFVLDQSRLATIPAGSLTTLKELMRAAVAGGDVKIVPDHFGKIYQHWVDNLHDWCISRQILYGHQIPIWYRGDEIYCGIEAPIDEGWQQDPDTLDTWFSSGLWTFSTLGWPDETADLGAFHPTTLINPGYEILALWVSRMIMLSSYLLGDVPFRTVLFHGIVRDKDGRKFSKSLNNGVDPLDVINRYGTDALRMALTVGIAPGNDCKFDLEKVKAYQHFANKLWNISRFILMNCESSAGEAPLLPRDRRLLTELHELAEDVTDDLDNFRPYLAAEKLYQYVWHTFADKILEDTKPRLQSDNQADKQSAQRLLMELIQGSLRLLHPFMPFVTEVLWEYLPHPVDEPLLITAHWPKPSDQKTAIRDQKS